MTQQIPRCCYWKLLEIYLHSGFYVRALYFVYFGTCFAQTNTEMRWKTFEVLSFVHFVLYSNGRTIKQRNSIVSEWDEREKKPEGNNFLISKRMANERVSKRISMVESNWRKKRFTFSSVIGLRWQLDYRVHNQISFKQLR